MLGHFLKFHLTLWSTSYDEFFFDSVLISHLVKFFSGDLEDAVPIKYQGKSSSSVLPYVAVACLGAILFGYHLGYVIN